MINVKFQKIGSVGADVAFQSTDTNEMQIIVALIGTGREGGQISLYEARRGDVTE